MSQTSLVLVESPAKAKTIKKYLGRGTTVIASRGHIKEMTKGKGTAGGGIGVDLDGDFAVEFKVMDRSKAIVAEIRAAAKQADLIYIATDPDREGEAIAAHLAEEIKSVSKKAKVYRATFNAITEKAVKAGIANAGAIDGKMVEAFLTRRAIDRIVGFKLSPFLWDKLGIRTLSAGRVQSVALRMILAREREIQAFKSDEYWDLLANLDAKLPPRFAAKLWKIQGKLLRPANSPSQLNTEALATEAKTDIETAPFRVDSVEQRPRKKASAAPFTTAKLQQAAAGALGFSVKKTMTLAQTLYMGVDIKGKTREGLITYMRTDSVRIDPEAIAAVREMILSQYGKDYLPAQPRIFKVGDAAQEAHEAIRPTDLSLPPAAVKEDLEPDLYRLYALIWNRFVASQMTEALFDTTVYEIAAGKTENYRFRAQGEVLKFKGFLAVYHDTEEVEEDNEQLPPVKEGEILKLHQLDARQSFTQPPARYSEATLVKALEENGIGRPSTYAEILATIQRREYVTLFEKRFKPTELGTVACDMLVQGFDDLINEQYTAGMEKLLDQIAEGKADRLKEMKAFWKSLKKDLASAGKNIKALKGEGEKTEEKCPQCADGILFKKWGRYGKFLSCGNYPECKFTRPLDGDGGAGPAEKVDEPCPNCGAELALKSGRFGEYLKCVKEECGKTVKMKRTDDGAIEVMKEIMLEEKCPECDSQLQRRFSRFGPFVACSRYKNGCDYIQKKSNRVATGVACPKDGGSVDAITFRGRVFYGCANYPKCDFRSTHKPILEVCKKCGSPFLMEKVLKKGTTIACPNKECGYERGA